MLRISRLGLVATATLTLLESDAARAQCLSWSSELSSAPLTEVYALASFDDVSGPALYAAVDRFVMRWDGLGWSVLGRGTGFEHGPGQSYVPTVASLQVYDDGSGLALYAGGRFELVDGVRAVGLARWDGKVWSSAGDPFNTSSAVQALAVFDDGSGEALYRGTEETASSACSIARWDGATWSLAGSFVNAPGGSALIRAFAVQDDGSGPALCAGGRFTSAGGTSAQNVARWDPLAGAWSAFGPGLENEVRALAVFDDGSGPALYAGGLFLSGVARFDGSAWSPVGGGTNAAVHALIGFDDGSGLSLYATGYFTQAGGASASHVARWRSSGWSSLGTGLSWPGQDSVTAWALAVHGGSLFAGGRFSRAGETLSSRVAEWRGCADPVDTFCFGDGTLAPCPCGNTGTSGRGCQNFTQNGGATLAATGSPVPDTLVFSAAGELPLSLSIFLQGNALISAGAPFGDGLRCTGGALKRLYVRSASDGAVSAPQAGDPPVGARSAALGDPIAAGSVRYYQTYYRDPNANFCQSPPGGQFNATNGVRVRW